MRKDEEFALGSLAAHYAGSWKEGEDPPDGYLVIGDHEIGIEVSRLVQHVADEDGVRPRYSDDVAAIRLANELDAELKSLIPRDRRVMLVLSAPIFQFRKTKLELAKEILGVVAASSSSRAERKVSIRGNSIGIYSDESDGTENKRIVAAVMNRLSNPNILENVTYILEDRIRVKANICSRLGRPIWLALINDYFLTEPDTYRFALQSITFVHPFEKILLISDTGSVDVLAEAAI